MVARDSNRLHVVAVAALHQGVAEVPENAIHVDVKLVAATLVVGPYPQSGCCQGRSPDR